MTSKSENKISPLDMESYKNFYTAAMNSDFQADFEKPLHEKRRDLLSEVYLKTYLELFGDETNKKSFYILSMMKANKVVYGVTYSPDLEKVLGVLDEKINKTL